MINVKDQVYAALSKVAENTTDGYPKDWGTLPAIQYTEEQNSVFEWTDGKEQKSTLLYRIDVWNNGSTSQITLDIDREVSKLGLRRSTCMDVDDPSGMKHKLLRYEGIIDVNTEMVYQNQY